MTGFMARIVLALAPLAVIAPAAAAEDRAAQGEAELSRILEGRVAGERVDCIRDRSTDPVEVIEGTAIVFRRGGTIYVNRPEGARLLDDWDLPVFHKHAGSRLCQFDRVELRDRASQISGPSLFLAQFIPYTRPAS
jgi:hypothetical protein